MTSKNTYEVNGSKKTETKVSLFKKDIAKHILKKLIENRNEVTVDYALFLEDWLKETDNYSEDAALVIENWLQENDYEIFDDFAYYKSFIEEPPTR